MPDLASVVSRDEFYKTYRDFVAVAKDQGIEQFMSRVANLDTDPRESLNASKDTET